MSIESYELARLGRVTPAEPLPARYRLLQVLLYALSAALTVFTTMLAF